MDGSQRSCSGRYQGESQLCSICWNQADCQRSEVPGTSKQWCGSWVAGTSVKGFTEAASGRRNRGFPSQDTGHTVPTASPCRVGMICHLGGLTVDVGECPLFDVLVYPFPYKTGHHLLGGTNSRETSHAAVGRAGINASQGCMGKQHRWIHQHRPGFLEA
ncbi:uncharacterized protein LOC135098093 isoform X2 [Scylla paramamosain]|uniref:uncharacterized protein LOC135098093 isoform X2 n=1 Tax=Scylla paramamosain TaxID=85552 RepID=UPI00308304FF